MDIFNAIERLGLHEYVGNAKGDTVGLVISNLSPEIKASLQTPWNAIGILGGRTGAGVQGVAMDEAVKSTNTELISFYMPRDTKGGGGHGCLILVGANNPSDARRAVEIGLEHVNRLFSEVHICEVGHLELSYTPRAGEVLAQAFGAKPGQAFGLAAGCPGAVGIVMADAAIKSADIEVIDILTPAKGTSMTNEMILTMSGSAAAVRQAMLTAKATGLALLGAMGSVPQAEGEPYLR